MIPSEPQRPEESAQSSELGVDSMAPGWPAPRWYHKMSAVLLVAFCLGIGLFLLILPWTTYWDANYFGSLIPEWHLYWDNMYVRGAVSGLGVVNLYISMLELYRLRRFARG
jgi:hypothetical protein